ncbi:MAG: T9SS type A sorting domain-containing protein [Flavobacteriales bacterium]
MKKIVFIFLIFVSTKIEAQNVYTAFIDSSDVIPSWPPPNDNSFTFTNGDYFYLINKIYPIFFNFWPDDPNLTNPPPFSTLTVQTLDTIIGFHFLNDSTFERLYGSVVYDTINGFQNISVFSGDGNYGQRFFLTYLLGVEAFDDDNSISKLFPNPADETVNIELFSSNTKLAYAIEIFDLSGQKITSFTAPNGTIHQFNTGNFSIGTYFVKIREGTTLIETKKLIINR